MIYQEKRSIDGTQCLLLLSLSMLSMSDLYFRSSNKKKRCARFGRYTGTILSKRRKTLLFVQDLGQCASVTVCALCG
jgi:hypothetical protein